MVPPRNATRREPPAGSAARCLVKSPTTPRTLSPGYRAAMSTVDSRSALADTSSGTNAPSSPDWLIASSRNRVFSDEPEPSSMNVFARVRVAISVARSARMARSARVG